MPRGYIVAKMTNGAGRFPKQSAPVYGVSYTRLGKSKGRPIPQILSALAGRITITLCGLLGCERGQRMNRLGLAPCGVYPAAFVAKRAVRSYRTFSPLPLRAVCFLRHFPSGWVIAQPARPFGRRIAVWSPEVPPPLRKRERLSGPSY